MSAVERVKAAYAAKLAEAEQEDTLNAKIPEGGRVHLYPLYGRVGGVRYGDNLMCGRDAVSWECARELVRALPPVSLTEVRDGCLSFRPTSYVDALPEEKKARWESETRVSPVLLHVDKGFASLEWTASVEGIGLVDVKVDLGYLPAKIGRYNAKRVEFRGGFRYERATFTPGEEMHALHDETGRAVAQLEAPIRWCTSDETPGRLTCYFVDLGATWGVAAIGAIIVDRLADLAAQK